jgi:hypothetical protein
MHCDPRVPEAARAVKRHVWPSAPQTVGEGFVGEGGRFGGASDREGTFGQIWGQVWERREGGLEARVILAATAA